MSQRMFTPRENEILRQGWERYGEDCVTLVAEKLGRSTEAVRKRARYIGLLTGPGPVRSAWSHEDIATLKAMWNPALTAPANARRIGATLNRGESGVLHKAERLGLREAPPPRVDPIATPAQVDRHAEACAIHGGFPVQPETARPRKAPPLPSEREPAKPNCLNHLIVVTGGKARALPAGVERIERRPITPGVIGYARRYLAKGTTLDAIADTFSVDPDALERALGREVAA